MMWELRLKFFRKPFVCFMGNQMNNKNRPVFDELEPRILLSGSPAPESGDAAVVEVAAPEFSGVLSNSIREVLFIDSEVDNYSELLQSFDRNVEVFVISEKLYTN